MSCAVCTRGTHLILPLMALRQIPSSGPIGRILEVKASISPTACGWVASIWWTVSATKYCRALQIA